MRYLFLVLLLACAHEKKVGMYRPSSEFHCQQNICVLDEGKSVVAVNTTERPIMISLQLNHIQNITVTYPYPFMEIVPAFSSKTLLTYELTKAGEPFAFDFGWFWRATSG